MILSSNSFVSASRSRIFTQIAGTLVSLLGAAALTGGLLHIESLKQIIPGAAAIRPNMAAAFVLCGAALTLMSRNKPAKPVQICAMAMAASVVCLAALTLGEHFLGWNLPIEQWLLGNLPEASSHPGRMASASAFGFFLAGSALFAASLSVSKKLRFAFVVGLGATLAFIGGIPLAAFLIELSFGPRWNFMGMANSGVIGAIAFMLLGSGLLALLESEGRLTWSLNSLTTAGFAFGALLMVLAAAAAFDFTKRMLETSTSLSHTQEILKEIEKVKGNMMDLESGQRGYIITGNENLLEGREQRNTSIRQAFASLRKLTARNPVQQHRLDQLQHLIAERDDWEAQTILIRREQGFLPAQQLIVTGRGISLWKSCRGLFTEMESAEYALLDTGRRQADAASQKAFSLLPSAVFLSLAILSLGVFFLNTGVSEQKQAEKALRESEAQLHTIIQNLDEGIVVSDLKGCLLQWNPAALKLHGYSDSDQDRRRFTELVDTFELSPIGGDALPVEQWPLARILRDEKPHELELRIRRIGSDWQRILNYGGTLIRDANSQPLMAVVTITDVTERKQADAMLRASEERYRSLFESNPSPMWVYDLERLSFLAVNAAAVRHYGYSQDEFLAMTIKDIRPPEDLPALMDNLSQKIEGFESSTQWRHHKKDGSLIDVEITSHDLMWLGRHAKLVLINDVTERNLIEREIRRLNVELEDRVRLRTADLEAANQELESFSYSVSHDLRAPLRAVDGFSQAVMEDYGGQLPEQGKRYLQTVRQGAQRMGVLIDDLLTFSRLSRLPLHKHTVDTATLVRDTLGELDPERQGRQIEISIGDLPFCHGDPALLKQVWVNLLSNALKYTRKQQHPIVEIGYAQTNGEPFYFVRDNGTGFDMQYADKLFGVFQRLHRNDEFEGTGVGLAIVQRIVHRHGGRIWAEAAPGRGATFHFTLEEGAKI